MKELEERIVKDGIILKGDILKVGNFLNQQIDSKLLKHMALEVTKYFEVGSVTKVLTIEASGIAFATAVAMEYDVPFVFAKKSVSSNVSGELYVTSVASYTHGTTFNVTVPKDYIKEGDQILIVDDFLACGNALKGLIDICNQAKANVVGCAIEIEKAYQNGGNELRNLGYKIVSLAQISEMIDGIIKFQ